MIENYSVDNLGIIHQLQHDPFKKDYGKERNDYGEVSNYLSYLRLGFINGCIPTNECESILDVGFGNGDFLRACQKQFSIVSGYDLSYDYLPGGCIKEESLFNNQYDIITFFDSLEHFEDISFLNKLDCKYVVISVPNCQYPEDDVWFTNWKHRRPNEHLHHFNMKSLSHFLYDKGFNVIVRSYFEDVIRKNNGNNILTLVGKKL
jgi:hypothetical protein